MSPEQAPNKAPAGKDRCVECSVCGLRIDFDGGSNYFCRKTGESIFGPVLGRPACKDFVPVVRPKTPASS